MQHAVDAGFAGVSLFALGYEDDAGSGRAIDTIAAQLAPATGDVRSRRRPRHHERPASG